MDFTIWSSAIWATVKIVLWLGLVFWIWAMVRKFNKAVDTADDGNGLDVGEYLWKQKLQAGVFVIALIALVSFSTREFAFRPKTEAPRQASQGLLDEATERYANPIPVIRSDNSLIAPGAATTVESVEAASRKNQQENEDARAAFDKLPNAKQ